MSKSVSKTPSEVFSEYHGKLPILRYSRTTMEALSMLSACATDLEGVRLADEKRLRAIPGAYRDIRLCEALTCNLVAKMLATVEDAKIPTIKASLRRVKHKIVYGPEASTQGDASTVVLNDHLETLMVAASENCKLCLDCDCKHCSLGKTLDACSHVTRGGRTWADIMFGRSIEKEDGLG